MSIEKKYIVRLATAVIFIAAISWLLTNGQVSMFSETPDSNDRATPPAATINQLPVEDPRILKVTDSETLLNIKAEQLFSLSAVSNALVIELNLRVNEIKALPEFTQITATSSDGAVSIITVSTTLTNIFVHTNTGMYEYAGNNFSGVVKKVFETNLTDDIYQLGHSTSINPRKIKANKLVGPSDE